MWLEFTCTNEMLRLVFYCCVCSNILFGLAKSHSRAVGVFFLFFVFFNLALLHMVYEDVRCENSAQVFWLPGQRCTRVTWTPFC